MIIKNNPKNHMGKGSRPPFKQVGLFVMVPFLLAISPLIGWWIGSWLDKKLGSTPYAMYFFLLMGLAAGFRELYRMIKRFGDGA